MFDPFSSPLLHFRDAVASRARPRIPDYFEGLVRNPLTRETQSREVFLARAVVSCTESEVGELNQEKMLLFPGNHSLGLVDPSYYARLQGELGIPSDRQLLAVVQEAPLGWQDYTFDLIGSYVVPDDPPKAPRFWLHSPLSTRHRQKTQRSQQPPYSVFEPWPHRSAPPILIAWRRRVAYQKACAWLEARWHPDRGETVTVHGEAYTLSLADAQNAFKGLFRGQKLLHKMTQPGRRQGPDGFDDAQEFEDTLVDLIRTSIKNGQSAKQDRIAVLLQPVLAKRRGDVGSAASVDINLESTERLIRKHKRCSWDDLVKRAKQPT
jgi:hypothetical protein